MNTHIIIENFTYIKKNNAINHIKKLVVYFLNYTFRHFSKLGKSVKIYKFDYSDEVSKLVEIPINFNDGMYNVIKEIININYKLYEKNNQLINLDEVINKINEIKQKPNNNIFLITSIENIYKNFVHFTNIDNENVKKINITTQTMILPNENITHFNYRAKFHEILDKDIFIPMSNYDMSKIDEKLDLIKTFDNINKDNLSNYIYALELIDTNINNLRKNNIKNNKKNKDNENNEEYKKNNIIEKEITEFYENIKDILNLNVEINEIINNFIKNFQKNTLSNITEILPCYKKIKILNDGSLENSYNIEQCVDFYQKLYLNNEDYNIKNNKLVSPENKKITINNINFNPINTMNNNLIKFTTSSLTLSNIYEEYNDSNIYGILINYKNNTSGNINRFKNSIINVTKYPKIDQLNNIVVNWMSICDYYEIALINCNNYKVGLGNIMIKDDVYGNTNALLPIYFNKSHWKLYKTISSYHMSFLNSIHEIEYDKNYDNIYFITLLKIFTYINFDFKKTKEKYIQLFIFLLRTCIQIMQENKYYCSLENKFNTYINSINTENYLKNMTNFTIRTVQYIIFNGEKSILDICNKITKIIVDEYIKENINIGFWSNVEDKKKYIEESLNEYLRGWLCLQTDLLKMEQFVKEIYKYNGFNKFIKEIDKCDGFIELDDDNPKIIDCKKLIDINKKINEEINFKKCCKKIFINYSFDIYKKINENNENDSFDLKWSDNRENDDYKENNIVNNNYINNDGWENDWEDVDDRNGVDENVEQNNEENVWNGINENLMWDNNQQ